MSLELRVLIALSKVLIIKRKSVTIVIKLTLFAVNHSLIGLKMLKSPFQLLDECLI